MSCPKCGSSAYFKDGIVKKMQSSFPNLYLIERQGKLGLGTAYITGFKWALEKDYTFIYEMDADFSHDPNDLIRLYKACKEDGADLAIGSRYISGVNVVNWPLSRVLMSYIASISGKGTITSGWKPRQ